jgi:hypothetical protein
MAGSPQAGGNQEQKAGELPCPGPHAGVVIVHAPCTRDQPLTATAVTLWLAVAAAAAAAHQFPFVRPGRDAQPLRARRGVDRRDGTGALDAYTGGVERQIGMAEVNGRTFLNNVSLGIYCARVSPLGGRGRW